MVAALVDGLTLNYWFGGKPGVPEYTTYCAGFPIGSATTRDLGHAFHVYHEELAAVLDEHPLTEGVRALARKRDETASAIQRGLSEMLIQGFVPGNCRYCPLSG